MSFEHRYITKLTPAQSFGGSLPSRAQDIHKASKVSDNKVDQMFVILWPPSLNKFDKRPWPPPSHVITEHSITKVVAGNLLATEPDDLWSKPPWPPPYCKEILIQLNVRYVLSCVVHQYRVTFFLCTKFHECWKCGLELLQSAVQDEHNCRETVHWRAMLLLSVDKWVLITPHTYMVKRVFLVGATLVEAEILQNTVMSYSCHLLAMVALMDGHTDFTVIYNYMNTCWDCTLISNLVVGKYLAVASLPRTNSISSKLSTIVECSCHWIHFTCRTTTDAKEVRNSIRGPVVTPIISSLDLETPSGGTEAGTSSVSSSGPGTSLFSTTETNGSLKKEVQATKEKIQRSDVNISGSDSETLSPPANFALQHVISPSY